jgi:hypothetical protein
MLGHPTGAKTAAITTMTANQNLTNHGMLAGKHPGAPCGSDTIVGRGEFLQIPTSFVDSLPTCSYIGVVQKFHCFCDFCGWQHETVNGKVLFIDVVTQQSNIYFLERNQIFVF